MKVRKDGQAGDAQIADCEALNPVEENLLWYPFGQKTRVLRREMFKRILSSNAADAKAVPWRQVYFAPRSR